MIAARLAPPSGADRYPEPVSEPLGKETILPADCADRAVVRSRAPTERNESLRRISTSQPLATTTTPLPPPREAFSHLALLLPTPAAQPDQRVQPLYARPPG